MPTELCRVEGGRCPALSRHKTFAVTSTESRHRGCMQMLGDSRSRGTPTRDTMCWSLHIGFIFLHHDGLASDGATHLRISSATVARGGPYVGYT